MAKVDKQSQKEKQTNVNRPQEKGATAAPDLRDQFQIAPAEEILDKTGSKGVQAAASYLDDGDLSIVHRREVAAQMGKLAGNRYLQRVMIRLQNDEAGETEATEEESEAPEVHIPETEAGGKKKKFLNKAAALKVIKDAFDTYKTMTAGAVKVLAQAEFQEAYDKVYGETDYSWEKYIKPKFGNIGGFAHEGVNYVNSDEASLTTTPHEMLHNNEEPSWAGFAGSETNEGVTEYLTFVALEKAGHKKMTHKYVEQDSVIRSLVATIGDELIKKAYFNGETAVLKTAVDDKCKGTWTEFKAKMDGKKWTQAKALAAAK